MNKESLVILSIEDRIATVTLNRPEALNALSTALRNEIIRTFQSLRDDDDVDVIILTGAGRAFTVGLDLKELGGERAADATPVGDNLLEVLAAVPQPIIGAINGYAITGGFELALMCDLLIASEQARFADTHARVGVVPGWGLSQRLPRLIGIGRAKELSLTGNYLDADTAAAWGLVNRVVPAAQLLPVCRALASDMVSTDRQTRLTIKHIIDAGWQTSLEEGLAIEALASAEHGRIAHPEAAVAARRAGIQARGRSQSATGKPQV